MLWEPLGGWNREADKEEEVRAAGRVDSGLVLWVGPAVWGVLVAAIQEQHEGAQVGSPKAWIVGKSVSWGILRTAKYPWECTKTLRGE